MGRIEKALSKVRSTKAAESGSARGRNDNPLALTGNFDNATESIDFSRLPNMVPNKDSLVKNRIVAAQTDAPSRSVYKMLRTRVLQRLRSAQWNVIGVTGTGPGEGKTITAVNLAFSLAQDVNHRVVLVDLDLRRPSIHSYLGIKPPKDLTDFLKNSVPLGKILVRPDEDRLAVMTNQITYRDSSEMLSSPDLARLIHILKNLGPKTITILDLPPVLAGDDVLALSPLIDALLMVVAQGKCRREDLMETQELLKEVEVLGVVLNQSSDKSAKSGYYGYY
jgi:protein-tyrosine kinase